MLCLSSTEAEYVTLTETAKEQTFIQMLLEEIMFCELPGRTYEDNEAADYLTKNKHVSARTKHIDIRQHYIRNHVAEGKTDITRETSENNFADVLTKNTSIGIFEKLGLGILNGFKGWEHKFNFGVRKADKINMLTETGIEAKISPHRENDEGYFSCQKSVATFPTNLAGKYVKTERDEKHGTNKKYANEFSESQSCGNDDTYEHSTKEKMNKDEQIFAHNVRLEPICRNENVSRSSTSDHKNDRNWWKTNLIEVEYVEKCREVVDKVGKGETEEKKYF